MNVNAEERSLRSDRSRIYICVYSRSFAANSWRNVEQFFEPRRHVRPDDQLFEHAGSRLGSAVGERQLRPAERLNVQQPRHAVVHLRQVVNVVTDGQLAFIMTV